MFSINICLDEEGKQITGCLTVLAVLFSKVERFIGIMCNKVLNLPPQRYNYLKY